ncbi:hypothetical protein A4H97_30400 [Niastella yeongjuensis]|uniref:Uncharacterized protein n=1 Tax=Niastella yeongjuensis TaxID=354355 RepID=A0A1V9EP45_9BACT|nr:hypothetical protein [Niastella yeongjuensis]OQP47918.1 hypothetical protein A4H97_30400 [Niastella yeongjuensis]SEP47980.1 hypothetical protein SAMN05660816_06678 [Niastella yeongjuensis]
MFHLSNYHGSEQADEAMNVELPAASEQDLSHVITANRVYNYQTTHHFFVGDESTVELFNAFKGIALQNDHEYFGILELHPEYEAVLSMLKLLIDSVPELPESPGYNAIQWMEDMHPNCWMAWKNATFYLSGGATLISRFQQYLVQKQVSLEQIIVIN